MLVKDVKFKNNKVEIILDEGSFFISKENYIENPVAINSFIDEEKVDFLLDEEKTIECKNYIIRQLNKKVMSEYEVLAKLKEKELKKEYIDKIIDSLKRMGLINDEYFSSLFVDFLLSKRKGKLDIYSSLKEKKIDEQIIQKVIKEIDLDQYKNNFEDYNEYLKSLNMKAEIKKFNPLYFDRIEQLTNKSNQFNLTTIRYSCADIEKISNDENNITLYGTLKDVFGDNGLVTIVVGKIKNNIELHIDLWLMSCRVLKRNMECAMLDVLVNKAKEKGIKTIYGYYYPTKKNKMVSNFYLEQGFFLVSSDEEGNKIYELNLENYKIKNNIIEVIEDE